MERVWLCEEGKHERGITGARVFSEAGHTTEESRGEVFINKPSFITLLLKMNETFIR